MHFVNCFLLTLEDFVEGGQHEQRQEREKEAVNEVHLPEPPATTELP